jgi:aspartate carbamoyltransferase catalytic subunit
MLKQKIHRNRVVEVNIKPLDTITETAKEFVQKVITPPLEEVGLMFADKVKLWRFKNQVNIVAKADEYLKSKGIKTRKVSLKIMAPLLEECSLEEDESLQANWIALLANTVSEGSQINSTIYSHILSQMTKDDATIFEIIYNNSTKTHVSQDLSVTVKGFNVINVRGLIKMLPNGAAFVSIDNLMRLRLIKDVKTHSLETEMVALTDLGFRFMSSCRMY